MTNTAPPAAVVSAAIAVLQRASNIEVQLVGGDALETYMILDGALLWPEDDGTVPTAHICARHPGAGMLGRVAYVGHAARHGGTPECAGCGALVPEDELHATSVGLGLGSLGYRAITTTSEAYAWSGPVQVHGAGLCRNCWITHVAGPIPVPPLGVIADDPKGCQ